jgi:hypothetical protein
MGLDCLIVGLLLLGVFVVGISLAKVTTATTAYCEIVSLLGY